MSHITKFARPYAEAAFEYALEHKAVEHWMVTLKTLSAIIEDPRVAKILDDPQYDTAQRSALCRELAKDVLNKAETNFVELLAEKNRLKLLPQISTQFDQLQAAIEKTIEVSVCSAIPLTEEYQQKLKEMLSKKLNRRIVLNRQVDPDLLGGLRIRIGDEVFDASLRDQLLRMREALATQ